MCYRTRYFNHPLRDDTDIFQEEFTRENYDFYMQCVNNRRPFCLNSLKSEPGLSEENASDNNDLVIEEIGSELSEESYDYDSDDVAK